MPSAISEGRNGFCRKENPVVRWLDQLTGGFPGGRVAGTGRRREQEYTDSPAADRHTVGCHTAWRPFRTTRRKFMSTTDSFTKSTRRARIENLCGRDRRAHWRASAPFPWRWPRFRCPTSPVTINVVDVAGNLALTQDAIELYAKKNPKLVAKFNFTKAPGARAARQAEGDAGCRPQRHRSRADRHGLPGGRNRAGAADQDPARLRREIPEPDERITSRRRRRCRSSRWTRGSR